MSGQDKMSGRDDESCDIMRHHATSCDRERKWIGSGWRKMSFDRRRCGRETRWREQERKWKRKAGGSRRHKGFPLHMLHLTMVSSVLCQCTPTITPDNAWQSRLNVNLRQPHLHPPHLLCTTGHCSIFSFHSGKCHCSLSLAAPGNSCEVDQFVINSIRG